MSKVAIKGAATGTGVFTLESPATNTDRTLVLPDEAGTVLTDRVIAVDASAPDDSVVVDASGNVGIGTSSPAVRFHVSGSSTYVAGIEGSSAYALMGFKASGTTGTIDNANVAIGANGDALYFRSGGAERARIDSSGNLLVGKTAVNNSSTGVYIAGGGNADHGMINVARPPNTTMIQIVNSSGNTVVGQISQNGTNTTYSTSSDYRLKNTIAPMTGALARVAALKPCTYKWNADGSDGEGFIAHELAEVCPDAVTGEKDAVDADGNPQYQGIDTSFLVATLTAAIQEQQAIIEEQKTALAASVARIETLEADVATLKGTA